ncbi:hypothetical protein ACW4YW_15150 [Methylobacillus pratensis]
MIPGLHEAHVRAFRLRNKALWLAGFDLKTRRKRLHELAEQHGFTEAGIVEQLMQPILDEKQAEHQSRMDELRRAVFR